MNWADIQTAPHGGEDVLVALKSDNTGDCSMHVLYRVDELDNEWRVSGDGAAIDHWNYTPTHWMPLPYLPE